jgi:hypothetical protein
VTYPRRPTKANREAFSVRAGAIGLLECCECAFPTRLADTDTGHEMTCQAHGMTLSAIAAGLPLPTWSRRDRR